jgi:hypothetical protein
MNQALYAHMNNKRKMKKKIKIKIVRHYYKKKNKRTQLLLTLHILAKAFPDLHSRPELLGQRLCVV